MMTNVLKNELLSKIRKTKGIEKKILNEVNEIKTLKEEIAIKLSTVVDSIDNVDEMMDLCRSLNLPALNNRNYFTSARENTDKRCPDHDKTMWHDVQFTVAYEIERKLNEIIDDETKRFVKEG